MKPEYPAPMLPPSCDLRKFPDMPLDVNRLRKSETRVRTRPEEFRAAIMLWCAAWHEVPAGSVPDDDIGLADLAGYGIAVKEWRKVRAGALRGFIKCSDGRLYHEVIVSKAVAAWRSLLERKHVNECGRLKKDYQRKGTPEGDRHYPTFDLWIVTNVPDAAPHMSLGMGAVVPRDKPKNPPADEPPSPEIGHVTEQIQINKSNDRFPGDENTTTPPPKAGCASTPTSNPEATARVIAECTRAGIAAPAEDPIVLRWIRKGHTATQVGKACAEACTSFKAPKPMTSAYIDPIIERIVVDDLKARRQADAKIEASDQLRQAQRERAKDAAPMPEHLKPKPRAA